MANQKNKKQELWNVFNHVAEDIAGMSDESFRKELESNGESLGQLAAHGRELIKSALKSHKQRNLIAARAELERTRQQMTESKKSSNFSPTQRRSIFEALMSKLPQVGQGMLTAQHRNLSELADADIESALDQLAALGLWDGSLPEEPESEG